MRRCVLPLSTVGINIFCANCKIVMAVVLIILRKQLQSLLHVLKKPLLVFIDPDAAGCMHIVEINDALEKCMLLDDPSNFFSNVKKLEALGTFDEDFLAFALEHSATPRRTLLNLSRFTDAGKKKIFKIKKRNMTMKWFVVALGILIIVIVIACAPKDDFVPDSVWVKIHPVQCFQNPWQQKWLESNKEQYSNEQSLNEALARVPEAELMRQYYNAQGIEVNTIKIRKVAEITCASCACQNGNMNILTVKKKDLKKMKSFGYTEATDDERRRALVPDERYCLDNNNCHWVLSNCCEGGKAFYSCYSKEVRFDCPSPPTCTNGTTRTRPCGCINNICEAK